MLSILSTTLICICLMLNLVLYIGLSLTSRLSTPNVTEWPQVFILTSVTLTKPYLRWLSVLCLPFKPSLNTFTQIFFLCRTEKDRYVTKSTYVQCHWLREAIDFGIDCTDRTWPHVPIKCVQHHASASPSPSRLQVLASCSGLLCSNACLWRTHRSVIEERAAGAGQEVRK